ncbi:MAG: helix-turn-helix domain-containing protein [Candidatus Omnitrophica bacterium]|nr:helix-turn-helix domain-containing protein [Candidatus Omnitrophota bacterium]
MAEEKLLTVRDVSILLGVSEKEVVDLAETGKIPAYKVGGVFLRFKKDHILEYQKSVTPYAAKPEEEKESPGVRLSDFFYFNDFYILAILIIALLLVVIFRGY